MHHKTGTLLVALQIAVSLAIIVNAVFIINQRVEKMNRPTGIDVNNLIVVSIRAISRDYDNVANIRTDMSWLREHPDVSQATVINHIPLSGSGSSTGFRTIPDENITAISTGRYSVDEHGLETLGVNLVRGRNFYPEEVQVRRRGDEAVPSPVVVVTQALADELFPDEDALGKTIYWGSMNPATIIGIIDHMQGSWVNWDGLDRNLFHARISDSTFSRYLIKAKPGRRDALMNVLEEELSGLNRHRVIRGVRAHEDIVQRSYEIDRAMTNILIAVIIMLVGLTALVIVGLASYFVAQRTRQIGTRRALGATRLDILRYFLVENWLITTLGASLGCILTVAISYVLETNFDLPRLDWRYLAISVLVLWVVSQFAAYWPARKAMDVAPAVATRSV
jgi:putative ABC transport system permease protein